MDRPGNNAIIVRVASTGKEKLPGAVMGQLQAPRERRGEACLARGFAGLTRARHASPLFMKGCRESRAKLPHAGPFFAVLKRRRGAPRTSQHPDGQEFILPRLSLETSLLFFLVLFFASSVHRRRALVVPPIHLSDSMRAAAACGLRRPHDLVRCGSLIYEEVCGPSGRDQGATRP